MGIFDLLPVYAGKWTLKSSRAFTSDEISAVASAHVVASEYGNSVCFHMVSGGKTFIPLSKDSSLTVGESVDMSKALLLTLGKQGENDIVRVEI